MRSRSGWKRGFRMENSAEKVKELVSIEDAAFRYGLEPNRKSYISCPFHEEDTPSLKLYPETNTFYCFGCGAGGDVITLARRLFGLDYGQAVVRLASDFGVVLDGQPPARQADEQKRIQSARTAEKAAYRQVYMRNTAIYYVLWTARRLLRPQTMEEPPHPLFTEALRELPWLEYWLQEHPWR